MSENNEEKCPDHFDDPYEQFINDATKRAKRLNKDVNDDYLDCVAWSGMWLGHIDEYNENPEMPNVKKSTIVLEKLYTLECIGLKIVQELKKLNNSLKPR